MEENLLTRLGIALLLTILIELGVLRLLGERRGRVLTASVVMNVLTNVPLNLCLSMFHPCPRWGVGVGETVVILVETGCYLLATRSLRQSVAYSVFCNAISYLTGLLIVLLLFYFGITM